MQEISLGELFRIFIKRSWIVVIVTVGVGVLVGVGSASLSSSQYEARGQIVLRPSLNTSGDTAAQNTYANQLVATSHDLIQSTEVLSLVSNKLAQKNITLPASSILGTLTVSNAPNSLLLVLSYKNVDQNVAKETVKAVMEVFQTLAPKYMTVSKVAIVRGNIPVLQSTTNRMLIKHILAGLILGFVLSLILIFILEFRRHTIRDGEYLSKRYQIKTIQTL
ncbi:YveK family protein [Lacticaseibacillus paracasei]|uniref:YveK family protein n=1 Tax=Lacticaseibacillus paracasei TaxID=1597 RepID=UPI0021A5CCD1|nr:Wzz/FepE/Etk N-terminal domain-containing protein [Lacticaseibacillus paracasei]